MLMQAGQINYALLNVKGINKNAPLPPFSSPLPLAPNGNIFPSRLF